MRLLLIIIAALTLALPLNAKRHEKVEFFAKTLVQQPALTAGDSTIVQVVLYASAPFSEVRCTSKAFDCKGGRLRRLPFHREYATGRTREKGKMYYTLVWEQGIIGRDEAGTMKCTEMSFEAQFTIYETPSDPLAELWGYKREQHTVKAKCKLPARDITVKEKPKRSTRDMMRQKEAHIQVA